MLIASLILTLGVTAANAQDSDVSVDNLISAVTLDDYTTQWCKDKSEISNVEKALKDKLYNLCITSEKAKIAQSNNERSIRQLKEKKCAQTPRNGILGAWRVTDEDIKNCRSNNDKIRTDRAALEKNTTALQKKMDDARQAFSQNETDVKGTRDATRDANKKVDRYFDDMKTTIFDLKLRGVQAESDLNQIAYAIDNAALGLYLRDRLAGLLNSDQMCQAVTECSKEVGKRTPIKATDLNKVFNGAVTIKASEYEAPSSSGQK